MPARKPPAEGDPRSLLAAAAAQMASGGTTDEPVDVRRATAATAAAATAPADVPVADAVSPAQPSGVRAASPQYTPPPPQHTPRRPGYGGVPPVPPVPPPPPKKSSAKGGLIAVGAAVGVLILLFGILGIVTVNREDGSDLEELDAPVIPAEVPFAPVEGYALEEAPADVMDAVREPFDNSRILRGALRDLSARAVMDDGELVALAFVFQFSHDFSSGGDASFDAFADGFKEEAEVSEEVRVAGHRGLHFTLDNGVAGFAVMKGSNVVMVEGSMSRAELQRLTTEFLARVP